MELIIKAASDNPLLANQILQEVPARAGVSHSIPNSSAHLSLLVMDPLWDKKSKYDGTFTFRVETVDPKEVPQIATWLKERFFGRTDELTIDGLPIGDDVIGNSRFVEVIREALVRRAIGKEEAKVSMMLYSDLKPAEQEKVERLDGLISERFLRSGLNERIICQGCGKDSLRTITFRSHTGTVASVSAKEFLAATDQKAVERIVVGVHAKFKMIVSYYVPGKKTSTESPAFKYLLTAEPSANDSFNVEIVDANRPGTLRALQSGSFSAKTDDPETALLSGLARLDSHHDGLHHITGQITHATEPA